MIASRTNYLSLLAVRVQVEVDPADTVPGSVGVLDRWGNVRAVTASGIRIFLPEILDVGNVRTRFPIFPVHAEGNTAFKDVSLGVVCVCGGGGRDIDYLNKLIN